MQPGDIGEKKICDRFLSVCGCCAVWHGCMQSEARGPVLYGSLRKSGGACASGADCGPSQYILWRGPGGAGPNPSGAEAGRSASGRGHCRR